MRKELISTWLFLLLAQYNLAQPAYPVPTGVYCSCGNTNTTGNGSVDPAVATTTRVKGILIER